MVEVKELEIKQKILLHIQKTFHEFCQQNNLRYSLFAGTLLGAVRHKGFIPWDDDIDVTMPRPDYDKLVSLIRNGACDGYSVLAYPDKNYINYFAKFCIDESRLILQSVRDEYSEMKINIDIFPVDGYPTKHEKLYFWKVVLFRKIKYFGTTNIDYNVPNRFLKRTIKKLICSLSHALFDYKYILDKEIELFRTFDFDNSLYSLCYGAAEGKKGKILRKDYVDLADYAFEGEFFKALKNYDVQLTREFGDYMKLPPINERIPSHDAKWYIKDELLEEIIEKR